MSDPTPAQPATRDDPFYVGYLTTPRPIARFVRRIVFVLVALSLGVGIGMAIDQNPPGDGAHEFGVVRERTGIVRMAPVPTLVAVGDAGAPVPILLVDPGKHGAAGRVEPFDGRLVLVRGTRIARDGVEMLELAEGDDAIRPAPIQPPPGLGDASWRAQGRVTLRGEVIDPKCYLGVMKPGRGKTHKACAIRCISGGVPPVLLVETADKPAYYLLVASDGQPLNARILPYVGEFVEVEGQASSFGGATLRTVTIDPSTIRRP